MKTHTLIDDFNLPQVDLSKWTPPPSGTMAIVPTAITERGISINAVSNNQSAYIRSAFMDMSDSEVVWNIQKYGSDSSVVNDMVFASNAANTYQFGFKYTNGTMNIYAVNSGTSYVNLNYSSWTYKYLRISHSALTNKIDWWAGNNADGSDQIRVTPSLTMVQVGTPAATSAWNTVTSSNLTAMSVTLAQFSGAGTDPAFIINGVNAYRNSIDYSSGDSQVYLDDDFTRFPLAFANTTLTNPTVGLQYGPYIITESQANTVNIQKNTGWSTPILNINASVASSGLSGIRTNMLSPILDVDFAIEASLDISIADEASSSIYTSLFWRSTASTSTPTRYELRIFNNRMVLYGTVRGVETVLYTHWGRTESSTFYNYRIIHVGRDISVQRNNGQVNSEREELFRISDTANLIQNPGHVGWRAKGCKLRLRRLNIAYGSTIDMTKSGQSTLLNAKKGAFVEGGMRFNTVAERTNSSTDTSLLSQAESDLSTSFESVYHYTDYSDSVDTDVIAAATTYAQARKKNFISWNAFSTTNLSVIASGGADTVIDNMIQAVDTIPGEVYVAPLPYANVKTPWSPLQFDEKGVASAASGSSNRWSLTDTNKSWTTNELVGATVRTSVNGVADWFKVTSNTATTIQLTKTGNLINDANSSFESGTGDWVGFGGGVLTTTALWAYKGTNALTFTGGGARLAVSGVEAGEHYTFSYAYQSTNRSGSRIVWRDANGTTISYQYGPAEADQPFTTVDDRIRVVGGIAPEGAVSAYLEIYHLNSISNAVADFVQFTKAARPDMPELGFAYQKLGGATYYIQRSGRGGTNSEYIAAFRYIRDRFRAAGSSANITWALSSRPSTYRSSAFMEEFFPGYDNVDHVMVHAVNPGSTNQTSWTDTVASLQTDRFYQRLEALLRGSIATRALTFGTVLTQPTWGTADPVLEGASVGLGVGHLVGSSIFQGPSTYDTLYYNDTTSEYAGGIGFQASQKVGWVSNASLSSNYLAGVAGAVFTLDNGTSTQKKITLVTGSAEPIHKFNDFESGEPGEYITPNNTESDVSDPFQNLSGGTTFTSPVFGGLRGYQVYKGNGGASFVDVNGRLEWTPSIGGDFLDNGTFNWGGKALSTSFYYRANGSGQSTLDFYNRDSYNDSPNLLARMQLARTGKAMQLFDYNNTVTASGAPIAVDSTWYRAQVDMVVDPDRPEDMAMSASIWDVTDGDGVRGAELQKITWPGTFSQLLAPNNSNFTTSVTGYEDVTNTTLTWATTPSFSTVYTPNSLKAVNTAAGGFTFRLKTAAPNAVTLVSTGVDVGYLATAAVAAVSFTRSVRIKLIFLTSGGVETKRYISNPYIINANEWTNIGVTGTATSTSARAYIEIDYGIVGSAPTTTGEGLYLDNVMLCTSPIAPTASGSWTPSTMYYLNFGFDASTEPNTLNLDHLKLSSDGYSHNADKSEWAQSVFSASSFPAVERVINWFADHGQEFVPAETINGVQFADQSLSMDADTRYDSSKRTLQTYKDLFSVQKLNIYNRSLSIPVGWEPSALVGQVEYMKLVERGYEDLVLSPRSGGLCLSSFDLGTPSVREAVETRPLGDGSRDFSEFLGTKAVAIEMMTYTNSQAQTSYFRDLLASWMRPNRRPKLVYKMRGHNEERYINLRPSDIGREWDIDNIRTGVAITPMNFIAVDGKDFSSVTRDYKLASSTTSSRVLTYGTARTYPTIRIYTGTASSVMLINQTIETQKGLGSARISLDAQLYAGEFIEIDTENRIIQYMGLSGSGYSYLRYIDDRSWFALQPSVNDLVFLGSSVADQAIVTVRDAWL